MRNTLIAGVLGLAACGGASSSPTDGGDEAVVVPMDVPDDEDPYQLVPSCDAVITWTLPRDVGGLGRVAAMGPSEAWVIGNHSPVPEGGGTLLHLAQHGTVTDTG